MERQSVVNEVRRGISYKFILDPEKQTIHVCTKVILEDHETHEFFATRLGINLNGARGGYLKNTGQDIIFESGSSTIPPATAEDVNNFNGDFQLFS